ncbi:MULTISPECIES: hypothetical protein [unclassified Pseudomonas]|uniref:hypothetical protein n=1 Tax=unclassified Pseudomonas TaxID=196821 RepID=UPI0021BA8BD8|nr:MULTISPECIES: hypothetical protein [unclassified Pseudomonas]MCT8164753.1 hypothetical protein [Pseudomonas sp. HD6422]MCT8181289.1 hypothetical protein [Pseudomonas sp. HD6421]
MTTDIIEKSDRPSAVVIEQILLGFGSGIELAALSDIQYAVHFASLGATKMFPGKHQTEEWFGKFSSVMRDVGWVPLQRSYEYETSSSQSLKLGAVAYKGLKVVGEAALSNPATDALMELASKALEGLGKVTEAQKLFKRNLDDKKTGTVGLATCIQNEAGQIILAISAVDATPFDDHKMDTVAFEWESTAKEIYSGRAVFVFNRDLYSAVREIIRNQLKDYTIRRTLDVEI